MSRRLSSPHHPTTTGSAAAQRSVRLLPQPAFPFVGVTLGLSLLAAGLVVAALFTAGAPAAHARDLDGADSGRLGSVQTSSQLGSVAMPGGADGGAALTPVHLRRGSVAASWSGARAGLSRTDRVVVKFSEGSAVRLRGAELASVTGAADLTAFRQWLDAHLGSAVSRHFARSEAELDAARERGRQRSGADLADLNLYFRVSLPAGSGPSEADAAVRELRALPFVETAFVEPVPEAPVVEDVRRGAEAGGKSQEPGLPTPDYSGQQGYLYASPNGINAEAVWGYPGGRGAGVKIIDIEGAWLYSHEDLQDPFFEGGTPIQDSGWRNHGTAVLGEMVGGPNGFGVTGIATDLQIGSVSIGSMGVAAAIDLAASQLAEGDLFLIELHAPGPNANGSGQYGYVCMEYWQDNFDAIQTAVANGTICIEAGGNGEQNLDDPIYENLFNRDVRYSGAILVGAGTPTGNTAEWFTNYGSRLDLNGWGSSVVTTGYGDLQSGPESQWYTAYFSGTSSASPIVSGAVACLQGMSKAHWGFELTGPLAMRLLYDSGTPWNGSQRIGRRPNLVAARALLLQGIGAIAGHVRDASTGAPIPGAEILLPDDGLRLRADETGAYETTLLPGEHRIQAEDFFHFPLEEFVTVTAGETTPHDILLTPRPQGVLSGTFVSQATGQPIVGGSVFVLNTPIAPHGGGLTPHYQVSGMPEAPDYEVAYGLIPGYGAAAHTVAITAGQTTIVNPVLATAQTFEGMNGGYTPQSPWAWGVPSGPGPGHAFSGQKLWATNLSGNYENDVTADLTLPPADFGGATTLRMTMTHWYDIEASFDGGNVQVFHGGDWIVVDPVGGYPADNLPGLSGQPGFSGISSGWKPAVFDLTPYVSSSVRVRLHFGSDAGATAPGWYVDDVAFDLGTVPAATPEPPAAAAPGALELRVRPNPFRVETGLALRLASPANVQLRIFDPAGREVRRLRWDGLGAGAHDLAWDGRDAAGRDLPAGAYLARVETAGRPAETIRLIKVR